MTLTVSVPALETRQISSSEIWFPVGAVKFVWVGVPGKAALELAVAPKATPSMSIMNTVAAEGSKIIW